jgi:hypothetical protein
MERHDNRPLEVEGERTVSTIPARRPSPSARESDRGHLDPLLNRESRGSPSPRSAI